MGNIELDIENMKLSIATFVAVIGSTSAFSASSFSGSSLKAPSNGVSMQMATGMGINGFGRIGRLVARIITDDADTDLNAINAGSATPDYMATSTNMTPSTVKLRELLRQTVTSLSST